MLKRRGNDLLHVVSTWNTRGVFVGKLRLLLKLSFLFLNLRPFREIFMIPSRAENISSALKMNKKV